jgi:hypothetical protein
MEGVGDAGRPRTRTRSRSRVARQLASRAAQGDVQFFLLPRPTLLFRLRAFFEGGALAIDLARSLFMGTLGFFNRCLGLRDSLFSALTLFRSGGFLLPPLAFALPLLSLICQCGLAGCLIVYL